MSFIIDPFRFGLAPFPPDSLAGLVRWYKADSYALSDGDSIGGTGREWIDQSSSAQNAVQSDAAKRPVYHTNIFGAQPAIQFEASGNQFLTMTGVALTGELTVIVIAKAVSASIALGNTGLNIWFKVDVAADNLSVVFTGGVVSDAITGEFNVANMFSWRRDLSAVFSFREGTLGRGDVLDGDGLISRTFDQIGGTLGASVANCHIGELCVYNQRHSDANIDLLCTNYFRPKWGLL